MAPRANWKGYLRLSLVSCPIALYPASSFSEKLPRVLFDPLRVDAGVTSSFRRVRAQLPQAGRPITPSFGQTGHGWDGSATVV